MSEQTDSQRLLAALSDGKPHAERLLTKFRVDANGCWRWTASKSAKGYGKFGLSRSSIGAHRVSYVLLVGPIPEGCEIDHLCRVRDCINPDHLDAVPHAVNVARGRTGTFPHGHRTHCDYGHLFDEHNTGWRADGRGRFCRTCKRESVVRYRDRNRELVRERDRLAKRAKRERRRAEVQQ